MRAIDGDALKDDLATALATVIPYIVDDDPVMKAYVMGLNRAKFGIDNAPTIESEPHWIPCSERLPEDGERVLATHLGGLNPDRQVIEHIYKNGEFTLGWDMDMNINSPTFGQRYMGKVVAWMPLPECYREGE